jgi:amino acid adenylation domain-containing protein
MEETELLDLVPGHARRAQPGVMATETLELDGVTTARLRALASPPPHATLLAAVQLVLRRYTGAADVPLWLPAGSGMAVLRSAIAPDQAVADVLANAAAGLEEALRAPRVTPAPPIEVVAVVDALAPGEPTAASADLTLIIKVARERPAISFVHDPRLLPARLVAWLSADLATLLDQVLADPARPVRSLLPEPTAEARADVAPGRLHRTSAAFVELTADDLEQSIPQRFQELAGRFPDAVAVSAGDGELTYRQLAREAAALAAAIGPGPAAGLLLPHGAAMIAAIMATLTAGRPYVPLDPTYPPERLALMLEDCEADVLIVDETTARLTETLRRNVRLIDVGARLASPAGPGTDPGPSTPETAAYILYTSGSTGRPKGVVQNHRNVLFQVRNHTNSFRISREDRLSLLTSFSFDASVTDLFTALLNGATSVPVDVRGEGVNRLPAALAERGVTVYHSTPTLYRHLLGNLASGLPQIRAVLLGGEEVTRRDVELCRRHLAGDCVFVNGYGATEISFALQNHVPSGEELTGDVVPVGHPLEGVDVALLAPDGTPACLRGEIAISSRHVALGYWRSPEQQAARFVEGPAGVRTYRTGDVGRRLPDGRIRYLGRVDRQVKVRGHRVELGEIEARLAALPGVAAAAAVDRDGIVAYVVGPVETAALRRELERQLPQFMLPRAIVVLDELPLTPTGKLDSGALPEPVPPRPPSPEPPEDRVERMVAGAWCAALGVRTVALDENFFEAGGHSLQAAAIQRHLERELGTEVPLYRLFQYPTVRSLAAFLRAGRELEPTPPGAAPLARAEARMARRHARRLG